MKNYTIIFACSNCGHQFSKKIEWGKEAIGKGGQCSYCGVEDCEIKNSFAYRKPHDGEYHPSPKQLLRKHKKNIS